METGSSEQPGHHKGIKTPFGPALIYIMTHLYGLDKQYRDSDFNLTA